MSIVLDLFQSRGIQLEVLADVGGHLSIHHKLLLTKLVLGKAEVVALLAILVWVEEALLRLAIKVLPGLVLHAVGGEVLVEVEQLDVDRPHGVDALDPGPLRLLTLFVGARVLREGRITVHLRLLVGLEEAAETELFEHGVAVN